MRTAHATIFLVVLIATSSAALLAAQVSGDPTCLLLAPDFRRESADSRACLVCHDGSGAGAISLHTSHPVERSYASAWMARRADLRATPDPALVLANGVVTCATCHDGASPHPRRTALPPDRLCRGCHDR